MRIGVFVGLIFKSLYYNNCVCAVYSSNSTIRLYWVTEDMCVCYSLTECYRPNSADSWCGITDRHFVTWTVQFNTDICNAILIAVSRGLLCNITQYGTLLEHINPLNAELNAICHLVALLGGATIVVVSRLRVNTSSYHIFLHDTNDFSQLASTDRIIDLWKFKHWNSRCLCEYVKRFNNRLFSVKDQYISWMKSVAVSTCCIICVYWYCE